MTYSHYSDGFDRLNHVVARASFLLSFAVILFRFGYLGQYQSYSRWPYGPFYQDDIVLAFLAIVIGIPIARIMFTAPIRAVEYVLAGFIKFERDDLSPNARTLMNFYDRGALRVHRIASYVTCAVFLVILWLFADTDLVHRFASNMPLLGSQSTTGYTSALLVFVLLRILAFFAQNLVIVGVEHWLHRQFGENIVDEVGSHLERRAAAKGYLPLAERLSARFGGGFGGDPIVALRARRAQRTGTDRLIDSDLGAHR